jgi:hypothetical protein
MWRPRADSFKRMLDGGSSRIAAGEHFGAQFEAIAAHRSGGETDHSTRIGCLSTTERTPGGRDLTGVRDAHARRDMMDFCEGLLGAHLAQVDAGAVNERHTVTLLESIASCAPDLMTKRDGAVEPPSNSFEDSHVPLSNGLRLSCGPPAPQTRKMASIEHPDRGGASGPTASSAG